MSKFFLFLLCLLFSVVTLESATPKKDSKKLEQLKILKSKLNALNKRNKRLTRSLQKSIRYSRKKQKKYDEVVDKFQNIQKGSRRNSKQERKLKNELSHIKDELALSKFNKKKLEDEIRGLLSSEVDIWKVVSNKTIILKKTKDKLIESTKNQINLLNTELAKAQKEIKRKKKRLETARNKILLKYADRDRLLSKITDDKSIVLTKKIFSIQQNITHILEQKNKYLFTEQKKLNQLKEEFQKNKDKNLELKQKQLERVNKSFLKGIKKWAGILDRTEVNEVNNRFIFKHKEMLESLEDIYNQQYEEYSSDLEKLELAYKRFINEEKLTFNLTLNVASKEVIKIKERLDKIKNTIKKTDEKANRKLELLAENREIEKKSFLVRKDSLEKKIREVNEVSKVVMRNSLDRLRTLRNRLEKINLEIRGISIYDKDIYTKKEQRAIIKLQIDALEKTDESLKSANSNIKYSLLNTLENLTNIEIRQQQEYQKESLEIDAQRNKIIKKEFKKLNKIKISYRKSLSKYQEEEKRNNIIIGEKEKKYQEKKFFLEEKLKDIKDTFEYEKNKLIENYKITLSTYDYDVETSKLQRAKALQKKQTMTDLLRLQKRKIIRNFDLMQQRINSVFIAKKQVIETNIEDIDNDFSRRIKTLRDKEKRLLAEKIQNELDYKNGIKKHKITRDFALREVEKLLKNLDDLEVKMVSKTTKKIVELEVNRKKAIDDFLVSLTNLDLAQKSFQKFTEAKRSLNNNNKNLSENVKDIIDSLKLLNEKHQLGEGGNPKNKRKIRKYSTKDRSIRVLEDILVKSRKFKGKYEYVKGGCFMPDLLEKKSRREVCVKDFYISNHEVTNKEYREIYPDHYSGKFENKPLSHAQQPVVRVSWLDALSYAKALSEKTGETYRLPTDAEWEYAARAGVSENTFYPKESDACFYANVADETIKKVHKKWLVHDCLDGFYVSSPVGYYKPNAYGLYDMVGNVWEWTCPKYERLPSGKLSCVGLNAPRKTLKISRGGSWFSSPKSMRFGFKYGKPYAFVGKNIGFRLIKVK
jgi:formylglycine-generating enzyme required for sulfatase activity